MGYVVCRCLGVFRMGRLVCVWQWVVHGVLRVCVAMGGAWRPSCVYGNGWCVASLVCVWQGACRRASSVCVWQWVVHGVLRVCMAMGGAWRPSCVYGNG
mgnify:CR=1 FL=1